MTRLKVANAQDQWNKFLINCIRAGFNYNLQSISNQIDSIENSETHTTKLVQLDVCLIFPICLLPGIYSDLHAADLIIPRKVDRHGQHITHNLTHHHDDDGDGDGELHYHIMLNNTLHHIELQWVYRFSLYLSHMIYFNCCLIIIFVICFVAGHRRHLLRR